MASGCLDHPELRYETEKAVIGTEFDVELCPEDLARIDRQIRFVEDLLEAHSDEKIEIYLYSTSPPPRCYGGHSCYDKVRRVIRSTLFDLDHEIVHAVNHRFARLRPLFWVEGVAVALDRRGTFDDDGDVLENFKERSGLRLSYATAGHFVRWLIEAYGTEKLRPLLKGVGFQPLYGISLAEAAARYEVERPCAYPPWFPL